MTTSDGVPFRFGKDSGGNYGYILNQGGTDTVIPFKKTVELSPFGVNNTFSVYLPQGLYKSVTYAQAEYGSGTVQLRTSASNYVTLNLGEPYTLDPDNTYYMLRISNGLQAKIQLELA